MTNRCKFAQCSAVITKGKYCSKSCASKGQDRSKRKPGGFALLTAEQRAAIYKKRSKSKKYKATRTNSFDKINARLKVDEEYAKWYHKAGAVGRSKCENFRKVSAQTLANLRNNPEIEAKRLFKVADACRQRNFGRARKCIRTEYNGITFRSYHEALFARCLDELGWRWEYEPRAFPYYDTTGKLRHYIPDFYLVDEEMYIEVKGFNILEAANHLLLVVRQINITVQMFTTVDVRSLANSFGVSL